MRLDWLNCLPSLSSPVRSRRAAMASSCGVDTAAWSRRILLFSSRSQKTRWGRCSLGFPCRLFSLSSGAVPSNALPAISCGGARSSRDPYLETPTLRDLCRGKVPEHILQRAEEIGYTQPTNVQCLSLPLLLSGRDCVLHAQTGSGKTLAYLLAVFSAIDFTRSSVQALIVVPSRELGIQVTKVVRVLTAKPVGFEMIHTCTVMALLDGGMLTRHKSWLKAEPPQIVVATVGSLCQMIEKNILKLEAMRILVIDEVDFMFHSSKQVYPLRKLLGLYSTIDTRQTVLASASIPQHNRFLHDCVQQKWTKNDVVHVHVNPVEPMPSQLHHKFVSEKSKRLGHPPPTTLVLDFLQTSYEGDLMVFLLDDDMDFNARASSFSEIREKEYLLVSTDISSRGFDLPQTTHIYNFDLPRSAIDYLHRAGRTGRDPFSENVCSVTSLITQEERFVLQRFENELMFNCEEMFLEAVTT
ncbi:DEAD-box ATP-dependent RNA helicase 58, chloroplastic-like isoform X2 [Zingiber officinale]|uniref:DEAD-box ATP-dependent RNA helicase 58, chloroplastic-like isoform X2 n=1 Tax=Zingiber officinale TaxID=94328 RepID=UPI001C4C43BF|nr:DEAD-box ATP-dependent RNA helicase 58, chloroplastic-like isoform X2 [Zingiber officinale]